jgi:hypothetical protein
MAVPSIDIDITRRFMFDYDLPAGALTVFMAGRRRCQGYSASFTVGARPTFAPAELSHSFVMAELFETSFGSG